MSMSPSQIAADQAEIERTKKLQEAHDKKVKAEVEALLDEATKKKIRIPAGTTNPDTIRQHILTIEKKRADAKSAEGWD